MTTPNIDSIFSAISAPPGGGPTRSPSPPDLFREHLQLQPHASPVLYLGAPAQGEEETTTDPPARTDVSERDDAAAKDSQTRPDDESSAAADEPQTNVQGCNIGGCGYREIEPPASSDGGELQADGAAELPVADEIFDTQNHLPADAKGDTRQSALQDPTGQPDPTRPHIDDATTPVETKTVTTSGDAANETIAGNGVPADTTPVEQELALVASGNPAAGDGPAESDSKAATATVVPTAGKEPAKRAQPAKPDAKAQSDAGKASAGDKTTTRSETAAAVGIDSSPDDESRQRRGREKPVEGRDASSPATDPAADRPPATESRIPAAKPLSVAEPAAGAGEPKSSGSPLSTETAPAPSTTPPPTNAPLSATTPTERLGAALGKAQTAERPPRTALTEAQQARLVQRVAKAFDVAQTRGETTIRLRLSPPQLGSLRLEVQMEGGALTARLEVETHAAREALVDNLHALRERLAQQNIRIENFDVDLTDRQSGGAAGRGDDSPAPRDGGRQRPAPQHTRSAREQRSDENTIQPSRLLDDTNIDVLI